MDLLKVENMAWFAGLFCEELQALCVYHDFHMMDPSISSLVPADKLKRLQDRLMSIPRVRRICGVPTCLQYLWMLVHDDP
jgi:hypothetical protein